ncbi:unnamed protein product [Urochloa decumbens]|uniref:Uncharacterized protein n=1 Tax=Urochloa decumbens TaxID=240449 RepID=A0ABC9BKC1_9POAL
MKMFKQHVEVVETALVAPSEETPRQPLWLSNLDLVVPRMHTALVYYYPAAPSSAQGAGSFVAPDRLKAALARALVPFYPLAGRLGAGPDGRLQIECNGEGALFVVARAVDLTGEEIFKDYVPSPEVRSTFVPSKPPGEASSPLALFQVTFLKCGGVVLGTGIHHVVADGVASFTFIQTWAALARGLDVAEACRSPPFHDRTLLRARRPPCPAFDHYDYSPAFRSRRLCPVVIRAYSVSSKLIAGLKSRCGAAGVSTFVAVTAHLWRCVCVARGIAPGSDTRLGMPANVRHRVSPPLPSGFFGNALVRDLVTARVSDVLETSLRSVAETIKKAVDGVDDAYARSVVDYLERELGNKEDADANPNSQAASEPEKRIPAWDVWVVSWLGMSVYNANFGTGVPQLVAPAEMFVAGMAFLIPCANKDDGITVLLAMEAEHTQCFKKVFYGYGE